MLGDRTVSEVVQPEVIADECGQGFGQLLATPTASGRLLKHDIMELHVAEIGTVCLIDGQTLSVGDLRIVASEIGKKIADPNSTGQLTAEQIEVYRVVPKHNIYLSIMLGAMTLVIGSVLGIWFDVKAKQHDPGGPVESPTSASPLDGPE